MRELMLIRRTAMLLAAIPILAQAQDGVRTMDTRAFVHLMVDELELTDDSDVAWDIDLSVGGDLNKFWTKTRGERSDGDDDSTELQALYSKSLLPFWNLQTGIRRDLDPSPARNWAVVAINGLAPYFFEVEAELFLGEGGQSSMRVRGEYELLLTQRLILKPEIELVGYGRDEPLHRIGSGLSEARLNIRLRHEFRRELAPYIGLEWHRLFNRTKAFAKSAGHDDRDLALVIGLQAWY